MKDIERSSNYEDLSNIVGEIYLGATNTKAWSSISQKIANWIGANQCSIFTPQFSIDDGGFSINHKFDVIPLWDLENDDHSLYKSSFKDNNFIHSGKVFTDNDLINNEDFNNSFFYKDLINTNNKGRMLAGIVFSPTDNNGKLVVIILHQSFDNPFSNIHAEKLQLLIPHLSRSLGVMFRLQDSEFKVANSLNALNKIRNGILLFNSSGEITYANNAVEIILLNHQRIKIKLDQDSKKRYLVSTLPKIQTEIIKAINDSTSINLLNSQHFSRSIIVEKTKNSTALKINFSNLGQQHDFEEADHSVAIAFINVAESNINIDKDVLIRSFSFTKAEIKVTSLLLNGLTVAEIARELFIAESTVKSHLKNIHQKTGVTSRAKLLTLLLGLLN